MGPCFFKRWYKLHWNIPFQYTHLTCECGHGQMCHAKQRLATDHCSLRGLWFTCLDDAPPYKPATKSTILILQIFSPVLCDNPSSYQVSDSLFVWMQIKFCQCRTSKGPLNDQALEKPLRTGGCLSLCSVSGVALLRTLVCFMKMKVRCEFSQHAARLKDISG